MMFELTQTTSARTLGIAAASILALLAGTASAQNSGAVTGMSMKAAQVDDKPAGESAAIPGKLTAAQRDKAEAILAKSIEFMRARQHSSGGWGVREQGPTFPAITSLVVLGFVDGPIGGATTIPTTDPAMQKALDFLLSKQREDGGIFDQILPSYNTAISLSAVTRYPDQRARDAAVKALAFLRTLQWAEDKANQADMTDAAKAVGKEDPFYGGVGYGRHGRPDLSNTAFFVEALKDAGVEKDDPAFTRALVFLQRTQMLAAGEGTSANQATPVNQATPGNDMAYAKGSTQGGFIYATSVNKDRVGVGQSNAGDIAESLSGPAGTVVTIALGKGLDGKPKLMTKDEVQAAMRKIAKSLESWPVARSNDEVIGNDAVVLLGATADNLAANTFEVRTPIQDMAEIAKAVEAEFTGATVEAKLVSAWMGESRLRAYGSMTYAGFKSLVYAGLSQDDPRVLAAKSWIEANYTVAENPSLGTDGYFYYLVAFSKALEAAKMDVVKTRGVEDSAMVARAWRVDLIDELAKHQNADGSFRPVDDRWMETDLELITAYCMIALQHALR